ncbi:MAG: family 78 glycoside hydrolase catalytic domain [Clostridia bacterium]|nr:family 78 glycoside hydrolase catalytic domain [Clostridia bacterium]
MIQNQTWICADNITKAGKCPVLVKNFDSDNVVRAELSITAKGVYYAELNGERVGNFIMAPGFTFYLKRHQYQTYDITALLKNGENHLEVTVSAGWYAGRIVSRFGDWKPEIIAEIVLEYADGAKEIIGTDNTWLAGEGKVVFSDIYDGEIFDATRAVSNLVPAVPDIDADTSNLIPQEGEYVVEREVFAGSRIFTTPKGETVVDFGQNLIGYPQLSINAKAGEKVCVSFAETLDKDGNFYNENYRSAKCIYEYTCCDGEQIFKPRCTFYGFRYIRIDEFPGSATLDEDTFTAIAVYSDMKKTGHLACSNEKLNQLFSNVFWGQRCNFLDIPTDCPQRDERLGWTGDAQVFCKTASYNFDTRRFFYKWLRDMKAQSERYGYVGFTVPGGPTPMAAAWSDAAVIVPWQIYTIYGDKTFLEEMIDTMIQHVEKIAEESEEQYTWRGGKNLRQFGDWLATDSLDKDRDGAFVTTTYSGATNPDFLQAAFYAYDTAILAEALEVLGRDGAYYRDLHSKIIEKFQKDFPEYHTQTECVIALRFNLTSDREATAALLSRMIRENGDRMSTGFVGTPHILHALSDVGKTDLAYTLLLQENFPSWLFSVNLGATTMWEHWDSINKDGDMWSTTMNSFNHYAYGAVADWIYEVAAGIGRENGSAGFDSLVIAPHPDKRLDWLEASIETDKGIVSSKWIHTVDGGVRYEITVPASARIIIDGKSKNIEKGTYVFYR